MLSSSAGAEISRATAQRDARQSAAIMRILQRPSHPSDTLGPEDFSMRARAVLPRASRSIAAVALLVASSVLLLPAQTPPRLSLVSTAWPPFTNAPGQPRFALDLVEAALGRFNVKSRTTIVSAGQFTSLLLNGAFDGSAAAWKDPERERVLIFSQPYLENRLVLVARHGGDVSAKTLADLKGKRIAIVEGYAYGDAIDRAGPVFVRSKSEEDSLSRLLTSGVDYTLMDELVVQYIVNNYPKESAAKLQIGSTSLLTRELYLAVKRTRPDAESIIKSFNAQLRGMIADRTYHRLLHVDWISADVNGDGVPVLVPQSDKAGTVEPKSAYSLFSGTTPPAATSAEGQPKSGFYVGGNIYSDWASVPDSYKTPSQQPPDYRRSEASIFKFTF
jgi:polar amino acid transport system substrate-binding protein